MCASFQEACVEVLAEKTVLAASKRGVKIILLGGGVAANGALRDRLGQEVNKFNLVRKVNREKDKIKLLVPELEFTGDNAAMIALAGYFRIKKSKNWFGDWRKIEVDPSLGLR